MSKQTAADIRFVDVNKGYSDKKSVLKSISFSIKKSEFVVLIGPSGCGKTTLLKLINGLLYPNSGDIFIKGKRLAEWDILTLRRGIGYVIQQIGLFPHLSIQDNISYVLKITGKPKQQRIARAAELVELIGLDGSYLKKYPHHLSGGQNQRVGVARALATDPDIIIMDEPFGAVDEITRKRLQNELLEIQRKLEKTIVFVTHDIVEAMKLADRIFLLNKGEIVMQGIQKDILFSDKKEFTEDFIGFNDFIAFLTNTQVADVLKKKNKSSDLAGLAQEVYQDQTLIEALKVFYLTKVKKIRVKNHSKGDIGILELNDIFS